MLTGASGIDFMLLGLFESCTIRSITAVIKRIISRAESNVKSFPFSFVHSFIAETVFVNTSLMSRVFSFIIYAFILKQFFLLIQVVYFLLSVLICFLKQIPVVLLISVLLELS